MTDGKVKGSRDIDGMMNDILDALDIIKRKLPNGELAIIQERMEGIENAQDDMKDDIRLLRKQLLDPEDGVVVRVNRNTEFRKHLESGEIEYGKKMDELKELILFKSTVTRVLWIIFTTIAGVLIGIVFKLNR